MRNLTTRAVLSLAAATTLFTALPAAAAPASHAAPGAAVVTGEAAPWQHDRGRHHDRHRGWDRGDRGYDRGHYGNGYRGDNYNRYERRDVYYGEPVYRNTRVWRGNDGRYYCRRENGTTGLLIGAVVGGMAGNELAGRRGDQTLGVILGAAGGALLGRAIDRGNSRCR